MAKEKIYDDKWYSKIKEIADNGEIIKAQKFLEEYILKYPNDSHAITLLITLCFQLNEIEKAEQIINNISKDNRYDRTVQLYHYFYLKDNYEEAYKLLLKILNNKGLTFDKDFLKNLYFERIFIESKLNIKSENIHDDYLTKQIINYDENLALEHIKKHCYEDDSKPRHVIFESSLDIDELFRKVLEKLKDAVPTFRQSTIDKYIFKYPEVEDISFIEGVQYKYLKVIVVKDTRNILTMYPIFTKNKIKNCIPLEEEYIKNKVKNLSQIEKFNKKYGKC